MKTHRSDVTKCPSCGYEIDAHSGVGKDSDGDKVAHDAAPKPGDVALCLCCLSYLVFTETLSQRVLTPAEFLELPDIIRGQLILARQAGFALGIPEKVSASRRGRRSHE